jgi:hypothetical protein
MCFDYRACLLADPRGSGNVSSQSMHKFTLRPQGLGVFYLALLRQSVVERPVIVLEEPIVVEPFSLHRV